MWEYNTYRAASTITTITNFASSRQTSSVSSTVLRTAHPVAPGDSFTTTETRVGISIGATGITGSREFVNHDVFAGTNATGGSFFYNSVKQTAFTVSNFSTTQSTVGESASAGGWSRNSSSSIIGLDGTTLLITNSNTSSSVVVSSFTTSFIYSTNGAQTTSTKLTLHRDTTTALTLQSTNISRRTFLAGNTFQLSGTTTSSTSCNASTAEFIQILIGGGVSTYAVATATRVSASASGVATGSTAGGATTGASSKTYHDTTTTSAATVNFPSTTLTTRSSFFPGVSSSLDGTNTRRYRTTSSSEDTFTQSTTATLAVTQTIYRTATIFGLTDIQDTVYEPSSTDWGWFVTTTGTDSVGVVGSSFNDTTTISATADTALVSIVNFTGADNVSPFITSTFTTTSFVQSTTASSRTTTSQSTYRMALPTAAADTIPFSNTTPTLTVSYVSTRPTTYTYTSATVTVTFGQQIATNTTADWTFSSSVTRTNITTTYSAGTSFTTTSYTIPAAWSAFLADSHSSSTFSNSSSAVLGGTSTSRFTASFTTSFSFFGTTNNYSVALRFRQNLSATSPIPTYTDITVQEGFQAMADLGPGEPFGTNIDVTPPLPMRSACASVYRDGPVTPVLLKQVQKFTDITTWESAGSAITANTTTTTTDAPGTTYVTGALVPTAAATSDMTLSNTFSATQFGGRGWDTTGTGTTISGTSGVHRATIFNPTGFTTSELSWGTIHSFSIDGGNGFCAEAIPQASSSSSSVPVTTRNVLTFSAFPSS